MTDALSPETRILVSSEWKIANAVSRRVVYRDRAFFKALRRFPCRVEVMRKDAGVEAVPRFVDYLDRRIQVLYRNDRHYRAERFLPRDFRFQRHVVQDGRFEVGAVVLTASQELRTLRQRIINQKLYPASGTLVDQGPMLFPSTRGSPSFQCPNSFRMYVINLS